MTQHAASVNRVRSVIDHIYDILQRSYHNRQLRALFDFKVRILNYLFGVATTEQLDAIRATGRHTMTCTANAFYYRQKHAKTMSSFMSVVNCHGVNWGVLEI